CAQEGPGERGAVFQAGARPRRPEAVAGTLTAACCQKHSRNAHCGVLPEAVAERSLQHEAATAPADDERAVAVGASGGTTRPHEETDIPRAAYETRAAYSSPTSQVAALGS